MTDDQWQQCTIPSIMITRLDDSGLLSERKARLFAIACCRASWRLFNAKALQRTLEASEQYADGLISREELAAAQAAAKSLADRAFRRNERMGGWTTTIQRKYARQVATRVASANFYDAVESIGAWGMAALITGRTSADVVSKQEQEQLHRCALLRELFGPRPFSATTFDSPASARPDGTILKL